MIPVIFLPPAIVALTELVATVVVSTLAARAASDLYDAVASRAGSAVPRASDVKEAV